MDWLPFWDGASAVVVGSAAAAAVYGFVLALERILAKERARLPGNAKATDAGAIDRLARVLRRACAVRVRLS